MTESEHCTSGNFIEKIKTAVKHLPDGQITLSDVMARLGREGYILCIVFLVLPFMIPVSLPGISTIFGAAILLIGLSLIRKRNPWLPKKLLERSFHSDKLKTVLEKGLRWLHLFEKISRPRFLWMSGNKRIVAINGFMIVLGALLLMAPFGFVPFSNTLPGIALLFLSIGMLQRDGGYIVLGYMSNIVTIVYFASLLAAGSALIHTGFDRALQII